MTSEQLSVVSYCRGGFFEPTFTKTNNSAVKPARTKVGNRDHQPSTNNK
ncbi:MULTISPECIES: hypothetical protein [Chroococcidiopsis]|nr:MULTISPECIES: hypothetical protein [Chroococcidiopsis]URD51441.1 hypothetical protein M5J74_05520 [Chroococcidiopsis sp. CCNUC1]